jgi:hypothetical protein
MELMLQDENVMKSDEACMAALQTPPPETAVLCDCKPRLTL